jgi:hypothetical protein
MEIIVEQGDAVAFAREMFRVGNGGFNGRGHKPGFCLWGGV